MSKSAKRLPVFRDEAEERRFWESHDSSDYFAWEKAERVRLPNLKPSTRSISLRATSRTPRTPQDRSEQARCPLSIADQDVACREGEFGVIRIAERHLVVGVDQEG
jgi:hypothetical protein